jgi:hypothetical protein
MTPQPVDIALDDHTADAKVLNDAAAVVTALDDLTADAMSQDDAAAVAMAIDGCCRRHYSPG